MLKSNELFNHAIELKRIADSLNSMQSNSDEYASSVIMLQYHVNNIVAIASRAVKYEAERIADHIERKNYIQLLSEFYTELEAKKEGK